MRQVIWKYQIAIEDRPTVVMPQGARILCVQTQNDEAFIWCEVSPQNPIEIREFKLRVTGGPEWDSAGTKYMGTFQLQSGFVGHLYEIVQ